MKREEYISKEKLLNGIYNHQDDENFDLMLYIAQFPSRKLPCTEENGEGKRSHRLMKNQ
jgi:hypothetical protein